MSTDDFIDNYMIIKTPFNSTKYICQENGAYEFH